MEVIDDLDVAVAEVEVPALGSEVVALEESEDLNQLDMFPDMHSVVVETVEETGTVTGPNNDEPGDEEVSAEDAAKLGSVKRGRGRPKKLSTGTPIQKTDSVKRGRGRPPKSPAEKRKSYDGPPRKRGRPKKSLNPDEPVSITLSLTNDDQDANSDSDIEDPVVSDVESDASGTPIKRPRGRPKKFASVSPVSASSSPRKRGRPRKNPVAAPPSTGKRKRGRPKKNESNNTSSDTKASKHGSSQAVVGIERNSFLDDLPSTSKGHSSSNGTGKRRVGRPRKDEMRDQPLRKGYEGSSNSDDEEPLSHALMIRRKPGARVVKPSKKFMSTYDPGEQGIIIKSRPGAGSSSQFPKRRGRPPAIVPRIGPKHGPIVVRQRGRPAKNIKIKIKNLSRGRVGRPAADNDSDDEPRKYNRIESYDVVGEDITSTHQRRPGARRSKPAARLNVSASATLAPIIAKYRKYRLGAVKKEREAERQLAETASETTLAELEEARVEIAALTEKVEKLEEEKRLQAQTIKKLNDQLETMKTEVEKLKSKSQPMNGSGDGTTVVISVKSPAKEKR